MYREFRPNDNLKRLISNYVCLDMENAHGKFFAPDITHTSLIVTIKSKVEIHRNNSTFIPPPVSIMGAFNSPFSFSYISGEITSFIADFQPIGMFEITRQSGVFFANKFVDATKVWGKSEVAELFNKLSAPVSIEERINLFDDFLEEKAPDVLCEKSLIVEKADETARANNYQQTVKEITHELGISFSSLSRAFNKVLGISPKQYFTRSLFEEILKRYTVEKQNTIDVLSDSPFYDFSHMNKWFKKFAHTSPSEFVNYDIGFIENVLNRERANLNW